MKVPFPAANNHNTSKPAPSSNSTTTTTAAAAPPSTTAAAAHSSSSSSPNYEPKSVLELRGSRSPVSGKPTSDFLSSGGGGGGDRLELEDHVLNNIEHPQLEDWDSLMRDLGLHDDFNPVSKPFSSSSQSDLTHQITQNINNNNIQYSELAEFPPVTSFESTQFAAADFGLLPDIPIYSSAAPPTSFEGLSGDANNNWNVGFDYVDELIRLAECFETNSLQLGQVILARLNQRLRSPAGKPIQRAAFYFKEALQSLLTGSTRPSHHAASSSEIIQTIKAQKTFSSVSPVPMFAGFTANQAVLEAMDGSMSVHVIDFDIGIGGHWASFMKELADKAAESRRAAPPALRISALVPEEYAAESRLIRENLTAFARDLNIRFEVEFVPVRTFQYLSFKAVKFADGEKVAVLLSPAIFRHVGTEFLNDLRRISPHVVVHVDVEGQMGFGTAPSYRQAVVVSG
ncbi:hypothetical protein ABFS83_12G032800 [Erythranthe nasuta]